MAGIEDTWRWEYDYDVVDVTTIGDYRNQRPPEIIRLRRKVTDWEVYEKEKDDD
jgi:hypothetical protein